MILMYHNADKVIAIANATNFSLEESSTKSLSEMLFLVAKQFPNEILIWCHQSLKEQLNISELESLFHHNKLLLSYNPTKTAFIDSKIGYVDASIFIQVNKDVLFPSWQMSSWVGGISAVVLNQLQGEIPLDKSFDYFLCSLAKLFMPKGLLCYSEPNLLKNNPEVLAVKSNKHTLFRFVKQHYKTRWQFLMMLNLFLYERKFPLLPFLFSFFYKKRSAVNVQLDAITVHSSRKVIDQATVDVIIPTIGRKSYLYDVLKDFSKQTLLPNTIIIIEQNPEIGSVSELDYLTDESWPFKIQHLFIHQAGACNARNLALAKTESEWVFLADDDNRFEINLLSDIFYKIEQYAITAATTSYLQENEIMKYKKVIQWPTFGAGNSFVKRDLLQHVRFNPALEFGYGEDGDFGMQLRNQGVDILYLPEPEIVHLKAPIGGFRTTPELQWQNETIQPKPSPTIMLYQLMHSSQEQIKSYKTILFFKYYQLQKIKNPLKYYKNFQKQWDSSVFWANKLRKQHEV